MSYQQLQELPLGSYQKAQRAILRTPTETGRGLCRLISLMNAEGIMTHVCAMCWNILQWGKADPHDLTNQTKPHSEDKLLEINLNEQMRKKEMFRWVRDSEGGNGDKKIKILRCKKQSPYFLPLYANTLNRYSGTLRLEKLCWPY